MKIPCRAGHTAPSQTQLHRVNTDWSQLILQNRSFFPSTSSFLHSGTQLSVLPKLSVLVEGKVVWGSKWPEGWTSVEDWNGHRICGWGFLQLLWVHCQSPCSRGLSSTLGLMTYFPKGQSLLSYDLTIYRCYHLSACNPLIFTQGIVTSV